MTRSFLSRLREHRLAWAACWVIGALYLTAALAPLLPFADPDAQNMVIKLQSPSWAHPCGTDDLGRDVLSRMVWGSRVSLTVGLLAVLISSVIGILVGGLAGTYGGWVDQALMRLVDIVLCMPTLFLILMLIVFLGPSLFNVMLVIGLTGWTDMARLVRAEFLSLKERDYVLASKSLGASNMRLLFKHLLPNALAPVFVTVSFGVAGAILLESGLSFLGLGVQPPTPSWGNILTAGKDYLETAWWLTALPGNAIFITVLCFNLVGDGLRDILDPRLRH